jgi:hypothetical protein
MRIESDEHGNPTGEVRPIIDREPPNAGRKRQHAVLWDLGLVRALGALHRSGTAHCRLSEAGNWVNLGLWGWKEPATCLTLLFWQKLLRTCAT